MRIRLLAVGTKMPGWVLEGFQEYAKRLPRELTLELVEIPLGPRHKSHDSARAIARESELLLAQIDKRDYVVALDVLGKAWDTPQLSTQLANWQMQGDNIALLIGGPDGLSRECLARAQQRWSLSALTLPHPLVRIVLAEQIYRAWTILQNHPYHK